jgi:hypothetical protein
VSVVMFDDSLYKYSSYIISVIEGDISRSIVSSMFRDNNLMAGSPSVSVGSTWCTRDNDVSAHANLSLPGGNHSFPSFQMNNRGCSKGVLNLGILSNFMSL